MTKTLFEKGSCFVHSLTQSVPSVATLQSQTADKAVASVTVGAFFSVETYQETNITLFSDPSSVFHCS